MRNVRQKGTKPELVVRKTARQLGLNYRLNNHDLPGSPDLANRRKRWVIFVHGCFWHRHEGCPRSTTPKRNSEFWLRKFEENVKRDERVVRELNSLGFNVLVVWECETTSDDRVRSRLLDLVKKDVLHWNGECDSDDVVDPISNP